MKLPYRILLALPILGVAAFIALGYRAAFEGGSSYHVLHLLDRAICLSCVAGATWIGFSRLASALQRVIAFVLCASSLAFLGCLPREPSPSQGPKETRQTKAGWPDPSGRPVLLRPAALAPDQILNVALPIVAEGLLQFIRHPARGGFSAVVEVQMREARWVR
jgi:hypothetical protein